MKFSNDLYQLIRSLNQSEKRYVKLLAKAFTSKGTENQLALFDAFDQQTTYDELAIRQAFEDRIPARNFHVAKNRLYNLILRGLYMFHSKSSKREKINQMIFQADILRQKGLYKQCDILLQKAHQLAMKDEYFAHGVYALERKTASYLDQRNVQKIKKYLDDDLQEELDLIDQFKNDRIYNFLELKTLFITHKKQMARSQEQLDMIQEIKKHPLLQDEAQAKSKRSRDTFWFLNGFICRYEGDYDSACSYWAHFVEEHEKREKISKELMPQYVADLNNLMFLQGEAKKFDEALKNRDKLKALLEHPNVKGDLHMTLRIEERLIEFMLDYYINSYKYKEGLAYIDKYLDGIKELYPNVGHFRQLVFDYNIACLMICNGKADAASNWLDKVFANKLIKEHEYIYAGAMILNLITHFELGNYQFLESLILNTYRMMYKRKLLYKSEKIIFKYLRKYLKMHSGKELMQSFHNLKAELQATQEDRFEKFFLGKLDLNIWIDSKIQETSMAEVVSNE